MNNGQPFSLVETTSDTTYLCAVGRVIDSSGNELAFHHLKLKRDDYDMFETWSKRISSPPTTSSYTLIHSNKKPGGSSVRSGGYYNKGVF